jgi:RNA polymerase sigma factor (sigma-70 family)
MGSEAPGAASDRELWQRAGDGDSTAFGEIFERHAKAVYNHLFRRISDWSQAEDLTSAVFLHAWRRRSTVVLDRESVLPWLLGVANQVLRNQRRATRRSRAVVARVVPAGETACDHADAVAAAVDDERQMAELRRALAALPRHEREVIELCVWSGLDQQAAAVALGVPVGTVKSRMHRARLRLAASLGTQPGEGPGPRRSRKSRADIGAEESPCASSSR